MKRRQFITLLGGAAGWPLAVRAQQPSMPVIGFLNPASPDAVANRLQAVRQGLKDTGYIEGTNVTIEYRWAEGQFDRLPELAADLVRRRVAVIVATGGPSPLAAKAATPTIPIVFTTGGDPVTLGLVASFNQPGGNVTGVSILSTMMEGKRLGLLRELAPTATLVAVLLNPGMPTFDAQLKDVQEAARAVGQQLHILHATSEREIDAAFAKTVEVRAGALLLAADPFTFSQRDRVVALAARYAMPVIYEVREYAVAGGLMSYGINLADAYRLVGNYAGRILRGDKPADLPVQQLTKFEFVINLKTAKALGLVVPNSMQLLADEVIE
jgi:putative tryptophan/tyrosine transport system substrate-binding protein